MSIDDLKSTDTAASWAPSNTGLTSLAIHALAIDPSNAAVLYAGTDDGVFQTVDGGMSWNAVNTGLLNAGTAPGPVTQAQLKISNLVTPVGDDKLLLKGQVLEAISEPLIDPLTNGVRIVVSDTVATVLDVTIPGGAFADPPGVGWKANGSLTKWTFVDKTAAPVGGDFQRDRRNQAQQGAWLLQPRRQGTERKLSHHARQPSPVRDRGARTSGG